MADMSSSNLWFMRGAFIALSLVTILCHLLPLSTLPSRFAPPDIMMAFTFAWVLRRPDFVPALSVAAVFLLADLLLQRPPGLMTALIILGCTYLTTRAGSLREASFAGEWLAVCMTIASITVLNRVVLWVLAVNQAQLGLTLIQMVLTMLFYPVAALFTHYVLRVRKLTPGDAEAIGART